MMTLEYEEELERQKHIIGYYTPNPEESAKKKLLEEACLIADHCHFLSVSHALVDFCRKVGYFSEKVKDKQAHNYIRYGVGRRFFMLLAAYQTIQNTIDPRRTEPLSLKDQRCLSRDINAIYINIKGILDNLAWCLLYQKAKDSDKKKAEGNPMCISLFRDAFWKMVPDMPDLQKSINPYGSWAGELKDKRDPVAHRIPLYVPPSKIVEGEESEHYLETKRRHDAALREMRLDDVEKISMELSSIGQFVPIFCHHPDEDSIPIYPTISKDVANIIKITNLIISGLVDT